MQANIGKVLVFLSHIAHTNQHPDMIIWSDSAIMVIIAGLTVSCEENMGWAFNRKLATTEELKVSCEDWS